MVAIELLPEDKWTAPSEIVLEDEINEQLEDKLKKNVEPS